MKKPLVYNALVKVIKKLINNKSVVYYEIVQQVMYSFIDNILS